MLFCALATDYDGTLAQDGRVDKATLEAVQRFRSTGQRLILVTGRQLDDLRRVFDAMHCFDVIVAENGAVLFLPASGETKALGAAPPETFVAALRARNIHPLSIGHSVVATWTPNETHVLALIRELGLDWQLTFNKGAVMCLPAGVNKASGLKAAVEHLQLSPYNVVGIGDAENDQAFLTLCGCSVAVSNALPSVKEQADMVTHGARGAGVTELINAWIDDGRKTFNSLARHDVRLGETVEGNAGVALRIDGGSTLISGSSGVGKSKLTRLLVERMTASGYQVCIVDPEGDYDNLEGFAHVGDANRSPPPEELMSLLAVPTTNIVLNLLGTELGDRPIYFGKLLGLLGALRARTGRPHWLVLDEAHHLSPRGADVHSAPFPQELTSTILITTNPDKLSLAALQSVRTVVALGEGATDILRSFCTTVAHAPPRVALTPGESSVLYWSAESDAAQLVRVGEARQSHQRHLRKYAQGQLGEDKSFYFRGPAGALNLRAHNLAMFLQMAAGVDADTWLFHLQRGDYSRWFRESIRDLELAQAIQRLETLRDAESSRLQLKDLIERRYAAAPVG
jgi:HAD superfamily hydrolase (TIGR01484 family)